MARSVSIIFMLLGVTLAAGCENNDSQSKTKPPTLSKPSTDEAGFEVIPPVNGGSSEVVNPARISTQEGVTNAESAQDAANAAIGQILESTGSGVSTIDVGSGLGFVACGQADLRSDMSNPNAIRLDRQQAAVRAYYDAIIQLDEFLQGGEINATEFIRQYADNIDTNELSLLNSQTTQESKLEMATEAYAGGYVLYDVRFMENEVFVSVIATPKTMRGTRSHNSNKVSLNQAENAFAGVEHVKNDIKTMLENNVFFPVGSKQIYISKTQEFAFLGFATELIRTNENWPATQKRRQKLLAQDVARRNASNNLLAALQNVPVRSSFSMSNESEDSYKQFEDGTNKKGVKVFDADREQFYSRQKVSETFSQVVNGRLPAGVQVEISFLDDNDDGIDDWAFAITYYIPSFSTQASQLGIDNKSISTEPEKAPSGKSVGSLPGGKPTKNSDL